MDSLLIRRLLLWWSTSHNCPDIFSCDPVVQEVHQEEVSIINNRKDADNAKMAQTTEMSHGRIKTLEEKKMTIMQLLTNLLVNAGSHLLA